MNLSIPEFRVLRSFSLLVLLFWLPLTQAKEILRLYTYHDKAPYFETGQPEKDGLYRSVIQYLNTHQQDFEVELHYMPRQRINKALALEQLNGGIIGVNPIWFKDKGKSRYLWTSAFMQDKDIFVSHLRLKKSPNGYPFDNLRFALTRGAYYFGISEKIKKGEIELISTASAQQTIAMLKHKRADVSILSQHTADYYQIQQQGLLILDQPHDKFSRHILFPKKLQTAYQHIAPLIEKYLNQP